MASKRGRIKSGSFFETVSTVTERPGQLFFFLCVCCCLLMPGGLLFLDAAITSPSSSAHCQRIKRAEEEAAMIHESFIRMGGGGRGEVLPLREGGCNNNEKESVSADN